MIKVKLKKVIQYFIVLLIGFILGTIVNYGEHKDPIKEPKAVGKDFEIKISDNLYELYGLMRVHFMDVGQGDCAFIELGNGQTMLIDAGNLENGDEIVDYIKDLQYSDINYVVATHPHDDHIGGMAKVLENFKVEKMYMPNVIHTSYTFENLLDVIEKENINLNVAKTGVSILESGPISIDILSPSDEESELNNSSVVIRLIYDETSFLFMGDAEKVIENGILNSGTDIDIDILKTGHHGSDTSSSRNFIEETSPKIAVISCGKDNMYGHPDYEVLSILNENNVKVYRTDEVGTVVVTADRNDNITVDKKESEIKENAPPEEVAEEIATSEILYRTYSGECYHRASCSYLKSRIEVTKESAKAIGLRPCSRCNPPK